jgi:hypothetical protein
MFPPTGHGIWILYYSYRVLPLAPASICLFFDVGAKIAASWAMGDGRWKDSLRVRIRNSNRPQNDDVTQLALLKAPAPDGRMSRALNSEGPGIPGRKARGELLSGRHHSATSTRGTGDHRVITFSARRHT